MFREKTHIGALLLGVWGPQVYLSTAFARKDIVLHGTLQVVVHGCWLMLCCLLWAKRKVLLVRIRSSNSGSTGEGVVNQ